jgi:hypothetical protein
MSRRLYCGQILWNFAYLIFQYYTVEWFGEAIIYWMIACFITPKVHCLQDEKSAACINVDKRIGQRICSTVFIPCMSLCKSSFGSWRRKNRRGQIIKSSYCFFSSFNRHVSTLVWEKVNWLGANVLKLLIHQEKKNHVMFLTKRRVRFQPIERRPY